MPLATSIDAKRLRPDNPYFKPACPKGTQWGSEAFHEAIGNSLPLQTAFWNWYSQNPAHFLKDCIKITSKAGEVIPLDVSHPDYGRAQTFYMRHYLDQWWTTGRVRMVVLKARQWGCTTLTKGMELWFLIFHPYTNALTVADDAEGSAGIVEVLKEMHENLPEWIKPKLDRKSRSRIQFDGWESKGLLQDKKNRSWIRVGTAYNHRTGRKWRLSAWHGSEVAFWGQGAGKVVTGCRNALARKGKSMAVLESTAYGWGGEFFDEWHKSTKPHTEYRGIFIPWFAIDEYRLKPGDLELKIVEGPVTSPKKLQALIDAGNYAKAGLSQDEIALLEMSRKDHFGPVDAEQLLWRRWAIPNVCNDDIEVFHQEMPATPDEAFITTGKPTFNQRRLIEMANNCVDYRDKVEYQTGELITVEKNKVEHFEWQEVAGGRMALANGGLPQKGHEYIITVDIAEGDESPGVAKGDNQLSRHFSDAGEVDDERTTGRAARKDDDPDNSVVNVFNHTTQSQVLKATGRFLPHDLAEMAVDLAIFYNNGVLAPEMNAGWGTEIITEAEDRGFENLYEREILDDSRMEVTTKYGWRTTGTAQGGGTRNQMISTMKKAIHKKTINIAFTSTISELMTMVNKKMPSGGIRAEHQSGRHDDEGFALMMGLQISRNMSEVKATVDAGEAGLVDESHPNWDIWQRYSRKSRHAAPKGLPVLN